MHISSDTNRTDLPIDAIMAAVRRPEVVAAMRALYIEADCDITEQNPICNNRGACCRFGQFGHRLYVTTLEICYYLATGDPPPTVTADTCPHAHDQKCHARDRRPLGCRIFFCVPEASHWQGPMTELYLIRLRQLHEELGVPYLYMDWMAALHSLNRHYDQSAGDAP